LQALNKKTGAPYGILKIKYMSIYYCHNEDEHRRDAERYFKCYGHYDYSHYDSYSDDACKRAYTDEYDKLEQRAQERREEYMREEEERERQNYYRSQRALENEEMWDDYYYNQQHRLKGRVEEPESQYPTDDLPF